MTSTKNKLQILLTHGPEDHGRAMLGLDMALAAAASNTDVTLFLSLGAARLGCASLDASVGEALADKITNFERLGGRLECCSLCAERLCLEAGSSPLREGVQPVGLASFTARASKGVPTISL